MEILKLSSLGFLNFFGKFSYPKSLINSLLGVKKNSLSKMVYFSI